MSAPVQNKKKQTVATRIGVVRHAGEMGNQQSDSGYCCSILDPHRIAGADLLEELGDLDVVHLDAAVAGGRAEFVLVIRAVDVDVARVGVDIAAGIVASLKPPQPQDARRDQYKYRTHPLGSHPED